MCVITKYYYTMLWYYTISSGRPPRRSHFDVVWALLPRLVLRVLRRAAERGRGAAQALTTGGYPCCSRRESLLWKTNPYYRRKSFTSLPPQVGGARARRLPRVRRGHRGALRAPPPPAARGDLSIAYIYIYIYYIQCTYVYIYIYTHTHNWW